MVVVLPAPLGPRIEVTWPRAAVRVSPSTARACRYCLTRLAISTAGAVLTIASLWSFRPGRLAGVSVCTTTSRNSGRARGGRLGRCCRLRPGRARPGAHHRRGGREPVPPAGREPFQPGRPEQVDPGHPQFGRVAGQLPPRDLLGPQVGRGDG